MIIIISLLVISSFTTQQAYGEIDAIDALKLAKKAWEMFTPIPEKPSLLIRFEQGRTKRTKLFKWKKFQTMDPKKRVQGPFAHVLSIADKLAKNQDFTRCELQYYDDGEALTIDDDDDLLEAVEAGPDIGNNKRLIEVVCDGDTVIGSGRYKEAKKAYDFAVMAKSKPSESEKDIAVKELEEVNLGGYSVDAEGVEVTDADGDDFLNKALDIAKAYKWDDKTISLIKTVPSSGRIFKSRSYVEFDSATWTFHGSFAKFAAWKSDKVDDKFSMFVATSKFEFTIPKAAREGNLADRYNILGADGGTVKQKYINAYKNVLKWEAIAKSEEDLDEPQPGDWAVEGNHTDL